MSMDSMLAEDASRVGLTWLNPRPINLSGLPEEGTSSAMTSPSRRDLDPLGRRQAVANGRDPWWNRPWLTQWLLNWA